MYARTTTIDGEPSSIDAFTVSVSGVPWTCPAPTTVTCRVSESGVNDGPAWESHAVSAAAAIPAAAKPISLILAVFAFAAIGMPATLARACRPDDNHRVVLVLDTAHLAERDRADALREAIRVAGVPASVTPYGHSKNAGVDSAVDARLHLWELDGSGTTLMQCEGTGIWLERTARLVRAAAPERLGLTLLGPADWTFH